MSTAPARDIPLHLIPRPQLRLCAAIGERIALICRDMLRERSLMAELIDFGDTKKGEPVMEPPNPLLVGIDIATVHLSQPLNLPAMMDCDPLWLLSDYANIKKFLDRPTGTFPAAVPLRFRLPAGIIVQPPINGN